MVEQDGPGLVLSLQSHSISLTHHLTHHLIHHLTHRAPVGERSGRSVVGVRGHPHSSHGVAADL